MFARFGTSSVVWCNRSVRAAQQLQSGSRQLSMKAEVAPGGIRRTLNFLYKHKQGFMNIVAMYFVLSMGLHQMRVKKAWDEREQEFDQLKATAAKVESNLTDAAWLDDVAHKLGADRSTLEAAIRERIEDAKPKEEEPDVDHLTNVGGDAKQVKIV